MFRSPLRVTRRGFLKTAAGLALPTALYAQPSRAPETLYNGIRLASPWPPNHVLPSGLAERPPYLASPPALVDIDLGRQLFVDDFLIEESNCHRAFHRATYHETNPILSPATDWERRDPHAINTRTPASQSAMVFSDGVFFEPREHLFKMWYMAGYQQHTALATSRDGVAWSRPQLNVVPGTNIVSDEPRDSNTVWLDPDSMDPAARYKMAAYDLRTGRLRLRTSGEGVHWREVGVTGPCGDRSTMFRNPFRGTWTFSLRDNDETGLRRYRRYFESREFATTRWSAGEPVAWTSADALDARRPEMSERPELYNLDGVAYESLMLGLFTIFRGERPDREKPNDICLGFSRDGFHWDRPSRDAFISVSERQGDWNWANVQSAGGGCVVVGDRLYFYVSGRKGIPGTGLPGECSTGLATLRRDGFASITDEWPRGVPRRITGGKATLTTRPVRFSGGHAFVNAKVAGELRVEVLDQGGRVLEPFSFARAVPIKGDGTRLPLAWNGGASLAQLAGQPVRFRFTLLRASVFAFWVSRSPAGHSQGYVAGGGPGYGGSRDAG